MQKYLEDLMIKFKNFNKPIIVLAPSNPFLMSIYIKAMEIRPKYRNKIKNFHGTPEKMIMKYGTKKAKRKMRRYLKTSIRKIKDELKNTKINHIVGDILIDETGIVDAKFNIKEV